MIALRILDIKKLIAEILVKDTFDSYSLTEAQVTTFCTFQIDGRLEREFFGEGEGPDASDTYVRWKLVRERVFDVIRGRKTPLAFKFVLFYPPELLGDFLRESGSTVREDIVAGLCINLRFDGTNLLLTTGTSMKTFTADRSCERAWDDAVARMLASHGILAEKL